MKKFIILQFMVLYAYAEPPAPYAPSGWKPSGPAFELPTNGNNVQQGQSQQLPNNQYVPAQQPSAQYGPAANQQQQLIASSQRFVGNRQSKQKLVPPATSYGVPQLENTAQNGNGVDFQTYLPPQTQLTYQDYINQQSRNARLRHSIAKQQLPRQDPNQEFSSDRQISDSYLPSRGIEESIDVRSKSNVNTPQNQYGSPDISESQNSNVDGTQTNQEVPQQYLPAFQSAKIRSRQRNVKNQQSFRSQNNAKRLNFSGQQKDEAEKNQNVYNGEYRTIVLPEEEDESFNLEFGKRIASRPQTRTAKRPESTTARPRKTESRDEENFEDVPVGPNVAVANAVSNGQYYLLHPDGNIQKVTYKTNQNKDEVNNNDFTANLVYQYVDPLKNPIYTVTGQQLVQL